MSGNNYNIRALLFIMNLSAIILFSIMIRYILSMNLTQWEFVLPLSLDELSRSVSLLSPACRR
ncbi:hypothetical protein Clopa_2350 [Clostridium pasteurianum BC1]|uniref:Uncharacterized protein n=1 Tax=Clostridium pasteurianum BC1 TaxID=86416 RepID=R4K9L0_CLOPA|nr:hypothetical protein Clopa_2350 [Clostridium pasteurianum BC1]